MFNLLAFADVMKSIGGVVLAVVILLVMVTVHEFGHYVAGKILNFKINEFSVGFGPAIFKKRSKKTGELFALRVVPLGGYCAFDGEDEIETTDNKKEKSQETAEVFEDMTATVETLERTEEVKPVEEVKPIAQADEYPEPKGVRFNDQAPWKRIIVLVAGATMNYLLALLLIILTFATLGQPMYKIAEPREGKTMSAVYEVCRLPCMPARCLRICRALQRLVKALAEYGRDFGQKTRRERDRYRHSWRNAREFKRNLGAERGVREYVGHGRVTRRVGFGRFIYGHGQTRIFRYDRQEFCLFLENRRNGTSFVGRTVDGQTRS